MNDAQSRTDEVERLKQDFAEEVRVSSAMSDALKVRSGHHVYKKISKEKTAEGRRERRNHSLRREEFREELRSKLQRYAEAYRQTVGPDQHIANIRELASDLSARYADILEGDLSFGVAAKAFNTYLKNRWCADGKIKPTHCPFDDRVLKEITPDEVEGQQSTFHSTWTDATEGHYREWIDLATKVAGGLSLSEWELKLWQDALVKERKTVQERLTRRK